MGKSPEPVLGDAKHEQKRLFQKKVIVKHCNAKTRGTIFMNGGVISFGISCKYIKMASKFHNTFNM